MRDYGLLFVAVLAFGALAATFVGLAAIAGRESAARAAGYAAAVDSVRKEQAAVEREEKR